jgi:hypothetical protein
MGQSLLILSLQAEICPKDTHALLVPQWDVIADSLISATPGIDILLRDRAFIRNIILSQNATVYHLDSGFNDR